MCNSCVIIGIAMVFNGFMKQLPRNYCPRKPLLFIPRAGEKKNDFAHLHENKKFIGLVSFRREDGENITR